MTRRAASSYFPPPRNSGRILIAKVKKIRRQPEADELSIRQTDDDRALRLVLESAALSGCSLDQLGDCRLIAWLGGAPIAALSFDTELDRAMIRFFYVLIPHRRRTIGSDLLTAARTAARTRGVRTIYAFAFESSEFLQTVGFVKANSLPAGMNVLSPPADLSLWALDISQDGIIIR